MTSAAEQGDPSVPLIVLGESPGGFELRENLPFVGPSGHLLDESFKYNKMLRTDAYILNVWPYRIRKDFIDNFFRPDGTMVWGNKSGFTAAGLEDAQPTLSRIRASAANVIFALGQQALALTTGHTDKITKYRGTIFEGQPEVNGKKVISSFHPSFILQGNYVHRYTLHHDLGRAKEESQTAELSLPQRELIIRPTVTAVLAFIEECRLAGIVATDLEVINHQVACFSLCHDPAVAMTVPLMDEGYGGHFYGIEDELKIWEAYASLMGDERVMKVNQNLIGFDAPFLLTQNNIRVRGRLEDTMIAQNIMYPEFPKGLDFICSMYTREPYYKDEGKVWKNAGGDWPQFWRYCGKDAVVALEAWFKLEREMDLEGFRETYEMTVGIADPLLYLTAAGLAVDKERLEIARVAVGTELDRKKEELKTVAEWPFNPMSSQQCMKYFYQTKGITPYKSSTTGRPTADDKAMARIFRRYNLREAKLVQEIRKLSKLKNTYIEVTVDPDGRLRSSWNARGTWTGRLSSSQTLLGTGMNLQNLHPMFKGFIVADPDDPT